MKCLKLENKLYPNRWGGKTMLLQSDQVGLREGLESISPTY